MAALKHFNPLCLVPRTVGHRHVDVFAMPVALVVSQAGLPLTPIRKAYRVAMLFKAAQVARPAVLINEPEMWVPHQSIAGGSGSRITD